MDDFHDDFLQFERRDAGAAAFPFLTFFSWFRQQCSKDYANTEDIASEV
jgi:hypothetical protein